MPRYLTATKLAALVLIDTYTTADLSPTARHEIINFLATRIIIRPDFDSTSLNERFEQSTTSDIFTFAEQLSKLPANVPGRSVYDVFLARVWALDGLDAVVEFVKRVVDSVGSPVAETSDEQTTSSPRISRASPLGQFIRRSNVEFTRLQFADAQALWSSFDAFRSSSYSTWATRNPEAAQNLRTSQPAWAPAPAPPGPAQTSTEDTSLLLSFSIHHLQKLGHRLPPGLKANLSAFLDQTLDSSSQSLQHFLAFFEHWRAGQYTMALESLHRYYDYSIASQAGRDGGGKDGAGSGGADGAGVRVYYQYALLHLSVLHADFERWEASVAAMEECVATARESQDTPCLLLALSWLLYLRHAHANSSHSHAHSSTHNHDISASFGNLAISSSTQADELTFLKTKAREMKGWSLLSSTLLDEGRGELASGNATSKALEHLLQAQHLNTTHDLRTQMPATMLFQAAALERLGQNPLAHQIYTNIPLLHKHHIPLPERMRAGCRLAQSFDLRGEFGRAICTLDALERELEGPGTLKSRQRVMGWRMVICLRRELRRDNIPAATSYHDALQPYLSSLSSDPDLSFDIFVLSVKLQLKQDQRAEALKAVNQRIRLLKQNPSADLAHTLTLLLLKARIFISPSSTSASASASSTAATSPKAFSLCLRAAATAQRSNLLPLLCEAVDLLAKILNELGEYEAARGCLEGVLPLALESSNADLQTSLYTTLTDSLIGVAFAPSSSPSTPAPSAPPGNAHPARSAVLPQADTFLDLTHTSYAQLEDLQGQLDVLVKKKLLADWKGDALGAEKAEAMYVQLLQEREKEIRAER